MSPISILTTPDQQLPTNFVACLLVSCLEQLKNSFSRFGVRLWNALPENIEKSASGNLLKKQMHETLTCINIFKQENLYLTPSLILEII